METHEMIRSAPKKLKRCRTVHTKLVGFQNNQIGPDIANDPFHRCVALHLPVSYDQADL